MVRRITLEAGGASVGGVRVAEHIIAVFVHSIGEVKVAVV